jgi:hypothetical protein
LQGPKRNFRISGSNIDRGLIIVVPTQRKADGMSPRSDVCDPRVVPR